MSPQWPVPRQGGVFGRFRRNLPDECKMMEAQDMQ